MPAGFDPVRDVMSTPSSLGRSNSFGSNFDPVRDASPSRSANAHHDYAVPPARYARELSRTPSADSQRSAVGAAAALPPPPAAPTQRSSRSASIADMLNSSDEPPRMHRRSSGAASASPHLVARAASHEYALHPGNANGVATRNERSPSLAHILNGGTPGAMPQRERRASQAGGGGASPSMAPAARVAELMSPGQHHHHLPSHHYQHELHPHHHTQQQQQQHRNSLSGSSPPQSYFPTPPPPPPLSHHTNILNSPPTLHATEKLRNMAAAGPSVLRSPPQMRVLSRPGSSLGVGPYDAAPPLPQPLGLPQHQRQRAASRDFAVPEIPRRSPEMRRAALPLVSPSAATAYEASYASQPHAYAHARERESMPSPAPSTPSSATFHPHHAGSAEYGAYPRTPLTPGGLGAPPLTPGGGERSVFAWPPAQAQGEMQDRHANPAQSYAQHAPLQFQPPPSREGRNPFSATPAQAAAAALGTAPSGALATLLSRPPAHLLHPAPPSATSSAEEYERERDAAMRHEAARQRALSQAQAQGQDREREAFKRELWEREQSAAQFAAEHRALISARGGGGAADEGDEEAREREREERAMWEREMERKRGGAATPVMGSAAGRKRAAQEEVEEEVKEKAQKPPAKKVAANGEAKEKKLTAAAKRKAAAAEAAAVAAAAQEAGGEGDAAEGEQGAEKEKEKPKARPKAKPKARAKKKEEPAKPAATAATGEEPTSTPTTAPGSSDAPASSAHTSPQLQQGASSPALAPPSTPQLQQQQVEKAPTPKATPKLTKRQREEAALAGTTASPAATPAKVAKKEVGASAGRNGKTAAAAVSAPSAVVAETEEELKKRERRASVLQPLVTPAAPTTAPEPPGAHVASVLAPAPSPSPAAPRPPPSVTRRPSVLAPPPPRPRSPTPPPQARRYAPTTRLTAPGLVKKPLSRSELEQKRALCRNPLRLAWCVEHPGRSDGWDEMCEAFGKPSTASTAGGAGGVGTSAAAAAASAAANNEAALVASHYNSRPDAGLGAREASPILPLRKFNNWIKSVLINEFAHKGGRTLDLGAGKGGDLLKWNAVGTRELVLVDIADQSIQQARARYQEKRQPFHAEFFAFDAFGSSLAEHIPAHILAPQFDNVTLQFCMHYAWERSSKALLMLENVSRYLKPGGVFIGTIPDAERLRSELRALPGDELAFGNDVYQVRFDATQLDKKQTCPPFGHKYTFWLKDAIDECDEYVVDFAQLESLATQMGLKLIYRKTFEEVWKELRRKPDHARLARQMGVANPDQVDIPMGLSLWQAASIYLCFAFQKV